MAKFCVVDIETTGLGFQDRIIEISILTLDSRTFEVIDEFDTLINPLRDLGPTHIHGVTASMVATAPTFEEVAGTVANILNGSILVAHNISFDRGFLQREFARLGIQAEFGSGFCTLKATKMKLSLAAETFGITLVDAHRALADTRACSEILAKIRPGINGLEPVVFRDLPTESFPRTLRRDAVGGSVLPRKTSPFRFRFPSVEESELSYLHMLNGFLDDGRLDLEEQTQLTELAKLLGISDSTQELHKRYFDAVYTAALRDEVIDTNEARFLTSVAEALRVIPQQMPEPAEQEVVELVEGIRICFTGTAVVNGLHYERTELHLIANSIGLQPVTSVTKKGCDLLVAADIATQSGKAGQAKKFGIPIMDAIDFLDRANMRLGR